MPVAPVAFTNTSGGKIAIAVSIVGAAGIATICLVCGCLYRKRKARKARQDTEAAVRANRTVYANLTANDQRRSDLTLRNYENASDSTLVVRQTIDPTPQDAGMRFEPPSVFRTPRGISLKSPPPTQRPSTPRPAHLYDRGNSRIPRPDPTPRPTNRPRSFALLNQVADDDGGRARQKSPMMHRAGESNLHARFAAGPPEAACSQPHRGPLPAKKRLPVKVAGQVIERANATAVVLPPGAEISRPGTPRPVMHQRQPLTPLTFSPPPKQYLRQHSAPPASTVSDGTEVAEMTDLSVAIRSSIKTLNSEASFHQARPVMFVNEAGAQQVDIKSPLTSPRIGSPPIAIAS